MWDFEIVGMGLGVDDTTTDIVYSSSLDTKLGLEHGSVERQSGVHQRYFVKRGISQSAFAAHALKVCADRHHLDLHQLDLLIATSAVPQQAIPTTASFIAHELGLAGLACFDINASCLGFVVSLYQAINLLQTHAYSQIGLVACDMASVGLNWQDLHASAIFGDGAVGMILQSSNCKNSNYQNSNHTNAHHTNQPNTSPHANTLKARCLGFDLQTYPEGRHFCQIKAGGTKANATVGMSDSDFLFDMDGKAVFKIAMQHTQTFVDGLLAKCQLDYADIDCVIMHQASHLGMKHAINRLNFNADTILDIYATHGNQVCASIPTVLYHAYTQGKLSSGKKIALLGTAAGFAIGGMILHIQ